MNSPIALPQPTKLETPPLIRMAGKLKPIEIDRLAAGAETAHAAREAEAAGSEANQEQ